MSIAIVGGGYSGVAVAINILRRCLDDVLVTLIERGDATGMGLTQCLNMQAPSLSVCKRSDTTRIS